MQTSVDLRPRRIVQPVQGVTVLSPDGPALDLQELILHIDPRCGRSHHLYLGPGAWLQMTLDAAHVAHELFTAALTLRR